MKVYRHKKRGHTYVVIGEGKLKVGESARDGAIMVVYRCIESNELMIRQKRKFHRDTERMELEDYTRCMGKMR